MRANKADVERAAAEEYHGYQAVLIAFAIENVPVIADKIDTVNALVHISQAFPVSGFAFEIPLIQRIAHPRVGRYKIADGGISNYDHCRRKKKTRPLPAAFQK
jgi:hypothetical protein